MGKTLKQYSGCAFYENEYCKLSDKYCDKVCRLFVKKYSGLSFLDHFNICIRRKEKRVDLIIRWVSIIVAIVSLIIVFLSERDKIRLNYNFKTTTGVDSTNIKSPTKP